MSISAVGSASSVQPPSSSPTRANGPFNINMHEIPGLLSQEEFDARRQRVDLQTALADFKAEARKTPVQRCRDEVMKEWHLTKESIATLPPEEERAVNARIDAEVARRMGVGAKSQADGQDRSATLACATMQTADAMSSLDALGTRIVALPPAALSTAG